MKTTIALKDLSAKLNGKIFKKEGIERVYIDRGYNTKKMKTTTFIEVIEGNFVVRCFIVCPSQSFEWCKSQEKIVINNVTEEIEEILNPEIEIIEEFADTILKIQNFENDCKVVFEDINSHMNLFSKVTFITDCAFFYWRLDLAKSFQASFFGTPYQDGTNEFIVIYFKDFLTSKEIKDKLLERHQYYLNAQMEINEFKEKCKNLENQGFKICGNSLTHGQATILKNNSYAGHINRYTQIKLI